MLVIILVIRLSDQVKSLHEALVFEQDLEV